jgi:hypothetical protein
LEEKQRAVNGSYPSEAVGQSARQNGMARRFTLVPHSRKACRRPSSMRVVQIFLKKSIAFQKFFTPADANGHRQFQLDVSREKLAVLKAPEMPCFSSCIPPFRRTESMDAARS